MNMEIEFDPAKRMSNLRKHGLDFMDASRLFDGPILRWRMIGRMMARNADDDESGDYFETI
jgi:hypothetical protein